MDVATGHRAERQCNTEHDPKYEPVLNYEPALYYEHDPDGVTVGVEMFSSDVPLQAAVIAINAMAAMRARMGARMVIRRLRSRAG